MIGIDPANPKGIVWLASYPKSGNTWVRAFIHALSARSSAIRGAKLTSNNMDDLFQTDRGPLSYERFTKEPAHAADPARLARLRSEVQAFIAERINSPVLIKTHNAHVTDRGFPLINDSVSIGAIYLIRDPLDVAISLAHFRATFVDQAIPA